MLVPWLAKLLAIVSSVSVAVPPLYSPPPPSPAVLPVSVLSVRIRTALLWRWPLDMPPPVTAALSRCYC